MVEVVEARRAQLLQRGERELHLPLHPDGAGNAEVRACLRGVLEQGRLADARLAIHRQDAAMAVPCALEDPVEHVALPLTAEQLLPAGPRYHTESMPPG